VESLDRLTISLCIDRQTTRGRPGAARGVHRTGLEMIIAMAGVTTLRSRADRLHADARDKAVVTDSSNCCRDKGVIVAR